ncbi:MAG: hypothetical protein HRT90_08780 [Candidatus Margulisbacteria bacterium]|nr:hypothetical protein [Candidatus Margulisiibacteriota bacterium]
MTISFKEKKIGVGEHFGAIPEEFKGESRIQASSCSEERQHQIEFKTLPYYKTMKGMNKRFVSKDVSRDSQSVFYSIADEISPNSTTSTISFSEIVTIGKMSRRKAIECLKELEEKGFIEIDRSNKHKIGNVYQLKWVFCGKQEYQGEKSLPVVPHEEPHTSSPRGTTSCARNIFPVKQKNNNNRTSSRCNKPPSELRNKSEGLLSFSLDSLKLQHKSAFKRVSKEDLKQMMNQFGFEPLQVHITQLEKRYRDTSTSDPTRKVCENAGGLLRTSLTRQFEYQDKVEKQEIKKKETSKMSHKVYEQTRQEVEEQNKELDSDLEKALKVDGLKEKATGIVKITFPTMREGTPFFRNALDTEMVKLFKADSVLV